MTSPVDDLRARPFETWPEHLLTAAYLRAAIEPGNPETDALLVEIERRGLEL